MIKRMVCPDCKNSLEARGGRIFCRNCKRRFDSMKGIPVLLPNNIGDFKRKEIEFYEKEFKISGDNFKFADSDWKDNTLGLLDFMDVFKDYPEDARILEVGAGNGQYSIILRKRGFKNIITSDISLKGILAARDYCKTPENKMTEWCEDSFIVLDTESIPFETGTFDIVFLTASLHHLPDPEKGIVEMKRCAKKGGLVIVAIEPNSWYFYTLRPLAKLLKMRRIDRDEGPYSEGDESTHGFRMSRLKGYFVRNGLKVVRTQRVWYLTGPLYYLNEIRKRRARKYVPLDSRITWVTLGIDRLIARIPLLSELSFHNTIIGMKV